MKMFKKFITSFFILLLLIFVTTKVFSLGTSPEDSTQESDELALPDIFNAFNENVPGATCGDPTNPNAFKCCEQSEKLKQATNFFGNLRKKLDKFDKNTVITQEWTAGEVSYVKFVTFEIKDDLGLLVLFKERVITIDMLKRAGFKDSLLLRERLQAMFETLLGGKPLGTPAVAEFFKEFLGNYTNFRQSEALLDNEFNEKFPDFGCLFSLCLSDIPKKLARSIFKQAGVDDILLESQNAFTQCLTGSPKKDVEVSGKKFACVCMPDKEPASILCDKYLSNSSEHKDCKDCTENKKGVWTGIGCIVTNSFTGFVAGSMIPLGVSIAGLAALLCIIYALFILQTSQGNPERVKKAREYLTNCIIGLLLIIFSVFILRLIGVNILKIPGFT